VSLCSQPAHSLGYKAAYASSVVQTALRSPGDIEFDRDLLIPNTSSPFYLTVETGYCLLICPVATKNHAASLLVSIKRRLLGCNTWNTVLLGNTHSCYICLVSSAESIAWIQYPEVESQGVYYSISTVWRRRSYTWILTSSAYAAHRRAARLSAWAARAHQVKTYEDLSRCWEGQASAFADSVGLMGD
jgi:hypothetical protein